MSFLLRANNISYEVAGNKALRSVELFIKPFEKIAIAGETGSGKSTLLRIIAGLEQPTEGEVVFKNQKVRGPADRLVPGHEQIAYLSQHFELQRFLRVEQVLEYGNKLSEVEAAKLFSICRITDLLKRQTNELSGGERQRIALAKVLICKPKLLLLDEPFSNLDLSMKGILKSVIEDIGKKLKITCLLVSHDPQDTLAWADEIIVLKAGAVVQQGNPSEIYHKPIDNYVAGLFGHYTLLRKKLISLFNIASTFKNIFVRPEDFRLVQAGESAVEGTIAKIFFQGGHNLLYVFIHKQQVIVQTTHQGWHVGDTVFVALSGSWRGA
jgi:iron(III) transport system ATP-binding protein